MGGQARVRERGEQREEEGRWRGGEIFGCFSVSRAGNTNNTLLTTTTTSCYSVIIIIELLFTATSFPPHPPPIKHTHTHTHSQQPHLGGGGGASGVRGPPPKTIRHHQCSMAIIHKAANIHRMLLQSRQIACSTMRVVFELRAQ